LKGGEGSKGDDDVERAQRDMTTTTMATAPREMTMMMTMASRAPREARAPKDMTTTTKMARAPRAKEWALKEVTTNGSKGGKGSKGDDDDDGDDEGKARRVAKAPREMTMTIKAPKGGKTSKGDDDDGDFGDDDDGNGSKGGKASKGDDDYYDDDGGSKGYDGDDDGKARRVAPREARAHRETTMVTMTARLEGWRGLQGR
jgi:hypothetical protein